LHGGREDVAPAVHGEARHGRGAGDRRDGSARVLVRLLVDRLGLEGGIWTAIAGLNDDLANFGFVVVAVFVVAWAASAAIYRAMGYERVAQG